jgi:hypothetical protein
MENNIVWTDGIELALNEIKVRSFNNSDYHKKITIFSKDILNILEFQLLFYLA